MMSYQKGNVLFLILIAVALFAALSYTVTWSGRANEGRLNKDRAELLAAEIIQYATQMEQAITRVRIINKVPEYGLDVSASGYSEAAANNT
ncbi:MAG: hypothetical protein CUN55_21350, partial [Phototrophicales bacterium]